MSDVLPASPGTALLIYTEANEEGPWEFHPILGWDTVREGLPPLPITLHDLKRAADEIVISVADCFYIRGEGGWELFVGTFEELCRHLELPEVDIVFDKEPTEEKQPGSPTERPTLRDMGVSGRACAPLEREGVETLWDLGAWKRADVASVKGVSRDSMKQLDKLLSEHDLNFAGEGKVDPKKQRRDIL